MEGNREFDAKIRRRREGEIEELPRRGTIGTLSKDTSVEYRMCQGIRSTMSPREIPDCKG